MSVPKQGNETRESILPNSQPAGFGYLGSPYNVADSLLSPAQVGVHKGDDMGSVIDAVKGVAFYTDQIGFGNSSSKLTQGMPLKPLGLNYFMNTGQTCSNGAQMYQYFEGIPTGNALGKNVQRAMKEMGMPALQGLVPGMIEDAEGALNPGPLLNAMLGTGYPQCRLVKRQVGDAYGHIQDPNDGTVWIEQPETAVKGPDGLMYQERWIQDTDSQGNPISLDRDMWVSEPKTMNPDGSPVTKEGFSNSLITPVSMGVLGILLVVAFGILRRK
jgi:hypothetical protein